MSVSVTTRKPRPGEVDGRDYIFIDQAAFERMAEGGELLEWARVFGNFYGTPRAPVEAALAQGSDVLFDIDWQGAQQLSERCRTTWCACSSCRRRPPRSSSACAPRAGSARCRAPDGGGGREISHWPEYDYVIVNTDLRPR